MDGEFLVQEQVGVERGVAGGNIIIQAASLPVALAAARRSIDALDLLPGIITPFPGGVAQRQQGRIALQEPEGIHGGCFLSDVARPSAQSAARGR